MLKIFLRKFKNFPKFLFERFDGFIGRKLLGNYAGYFFDKKKYKKLDNQLRSGPIVEFGTTRGTFEKDKHGVLKLVSARADDLLSLPEVDESLSRSNLHKKIRAKQVLTNLDNYIPEIKSIVTGEAKNVAEQFFGGKFSLKEIALIRTFHVENHISEKHETIADRYHLDVNDEILLNMFIAIEDITSKQGPFTFYDKNSSEYLIKNYFKHRDTPIYFYEKMMKPKNFTGQVGDWFFFDGAHVFHRASIPEKGMQRTVIQILLEPEYV